MHTFPFQYENFLIHYQEYKVKDGKETKIPISSEKDIFKHLLLKHPNSPKIAPCCVFNSEWVYNTTFENLIA